MQHNLLYSNTGKLVKLMSQKQVFRSLSLPYQKKIWLAQRHVSSHIIFASLLHTKRRPAWALLV